MEHLRDLGLIGGFLVGLWQAVWLYRQRVASAGRTEGAFDTPAQALYRGLWAVVLWTLAGLYIVILWLLGALFMALAGFGIGPRSKMISKPAR